MNDTRFYIRVILKATVLFILINLIFATADPLASVGKLSWYNSLLPGRLRFPYGERPDKAYNLSLNNLEAMFSSHVVSETKKKNEYRILVFGDSSVWGYLLNNDQTLTGNLNQRRMKTGQGKDVIFYNLGYPTISLAKDLLFIQEAKKFDADMFLWLTTLEAFTYKKQLDSPLVENQARKMRQLISDYRLNIDANDQRFSNPSWWDKTIIGQRRAWADIFRLQFYAIPWAATGIDQFYPDRFDPPVNDQKTEKEYYALLPGQLDANSLAFDVLSSGEKMAAGTPMLIVNEPVFISTGKNSDIRYNFFYPRWVYDDYRNLMDNISQKNNWNYLDAWNAIPPEEFSNSAIHLSPQGSVRLSDIIAGKILELVH